MKNFLYDLEQLIKERFIKRPQKSYTTELFEGGLDRILKKIGEEAGEVIIAAKNNDKTELSNEAADLIFHLMVVLRNQGVSVDEVINVLKERHSKKSEH